MIFEGVVYCRKGFMPFLIGCTIAIVSCAIILKAPKIIPEESSRILRGSNSVVGKVIFSWCSELTVQTTQSLSYSILGRRS